MTLFFDGGSRGNPGPSGSGWIIIDDVVTAGYAYHDVGTNNVAEYTGLIHGLRAAREKGMIKLKCYGDSDLVVKQCNGIYRVRAPHLKPLHAEAVDLLQKTSSIISHVPRAENKLADALANQAMDNASPEPVQWEVEGEPTLASLQTRKRVKTSD